MKEQGKTMKEFLKKLSKKINSKQGEKNIDEGVNEKFYENTINSLLMDDVEKDSRDKDLALQSSNYEKIKSIVNLFSKFETQYIAGKLHEIHVALNNLNRVFIEIMTEMEKKAALSDAKQGASLLLEREALRKIYDAITKPLCNGTFNSIVDLVKLENKVKFFVLLYNSGLSHKEMAKRLAERMGVSRTYIEEIFNKIKNITQEEFAWQNTLLTSEQISAIYKKLGLLDAYQEFGKRAEIIISNLATLKERMPELYLKVRAIVEEMFDRSGCKINIDETLAQFEKNRLQQGQIPLTDETAVSMAEEFKKYEEQVGNKVDAEKFKNYVTEQQKTALREIKKIKAAYNVKNIHRLLRRHAEIVKQQKPKLLKEAKVKAVAKKAKEVKPNEVKVEEKPSSSNGEEFVIRKSRRHKL